MIKTIQVRYCGECPYYTYEGDNVARCEWDDKLIPDGLDICKDFPVWCSL